LLPKLASRLTHSPRSGSFDHLHPGHKILLSTALSLATRKIIVGVSDAALLTKKAFADQLEPLPTRLARTERFCRLFRPGLEEYEVVPIQDVYGPTATEADVQALVLSQETTAGGAAGEQSAPSRPLRRFRRGR
jgi:pantetheine-phosphate adenylyltransferase